MINKLDPEHFYKIKSLLKSETENEHMLLTAIINGTNKGCIYVDDSNKPQTALVYGVGLGYCFVGQPDNHNFLNSLNDYINNELKNDSFELCGGTWFLATVFSEEWEQSLDIVFATRKHGKYYNYYYEFNKDKFLQNKEHAKNFPEGFTIEKINEGVFLKDKENMLEEVLEFWDSRDIFCEKGIGYVIIKDESIVSACFSCLVNKNQHEIVVETFIDDEQNKGLGTIVAQAYIDECLEKNVIPFWSTDNTNIASQKLANKLGFDYKYKLRTYEFEF